MTEVQGAIACGLLMFIAVETAYATLLLAQIVRALRKEGWRHG